MPNALRPGTPTLQHHPPQTRRPTASPKVETTFRAEALAADLKPLAREAKEANATADIMRRRGAHLRPKLLARDPKNPYLLSNQAVVLLYRQDKPKGAEVVLKKAVAVASPHDAFCLSTLGIVYYKMHRYDEAISYLTLALQTDPKNAHGAQLSRDHVQTRRVGRRRRWRNFKRPST